MSRRDIPTDRGRSSPFHWIDFSSSEGTKAQRWECEDRRPIGRSITFSEALRLGGSLALPFPSRSLRLGARIRLALLFRAHLGPLLPDAVKRVCRPNKQLAIG